MPQPVKIRFAPSPTGTLHTGGVRTALFNYIFAKQNNGQFVLRIDDTDKIRSTREFEQDILSGLKWVGLDHDEIYHQSERSEIYKKFLNQLLAENKIYLSQEKAEKEGDRTEVIRFKNPNKKVRFADLIKSEIEFDTTELGDFIVAKDLETPLYHFASVVDDFDLNITHTIRGEDHISNTPRQILMWEALGATIPKFAHLPLILAPDRSKLSKRKHASIASLNNFISDGYLPEAMINFLAFLGWNPGTEQELFTLPELIKIFELTKVQKSSAIFNQEKLDWYNREYLKKLSDEEFATLTQTAVNLAPELKTRVTTLAEAKKLEAEFDFLGQAPQPNKELLKTIEFLPAVINLLEKIPDNNFTAEKIKTAIWGFATEKGRGAVLWPMRVALTGKKQSPDPFFVAGILGKAESLKRLNHAANL